MEKRGTFVYLACPVNPLKGLELSALNYARTLVFGVFQPGMTQTILNSNMVRSDGADAETDVSIRYYTDVYYGSIHPWLLAYFKQLFLMR